MQINFGRAIKVNTNLPPINNKFNSVNPAVRDIFDVLSGEDSIYLNKEKTEEVRNFLRKQVGDYSDSTGAIYRTVKENTFLFTGSDVLKVRDIEQKTRQALKNTKVFQEKKETRENKDSSLLDLIEDGIGYKKKYIELFIASEDNKNVSQLMVYKWPYEDVTLGSSVLNLKG